MNGQDSCMLEEYVNGEHSIPVCMAFDSDRWDDCRILGMMHMTRKIASENKMRAWQILNPLHRKSRPSRKPYNHWRMFNTSLQAMSIGDAVDDVTGLKLASSTQTTLRDYFQ